LRQLTARESAMQEDAHDGTHPVVTPIHDVIDAAGAFDRITYAKGAAVVHTIEDYLGEDTFRDGVRAYMHEHAFANAVTDDLWRALDRLAPKASVIQIAHGLTLQEGVPLVQVSKQTCDADRTALVLEQQGFQVHAGAPAPAKPPHAWLLPVRLRDGTGAVSQILLTPGKAQSFELPGCGPVVNAGFPGYFRVNYPNEVWQQLPHAFDGLPSDDQAGLLFDAAALATEGDLPLPTYLDLLHQALGSEDPFVAHSAVIQAQQILRRLDDAPNAAAWAAYLQRRLQAQRSRLGWTEQPNESEAVSLLRSAVIRLLGEAGDPDVQREMMSRFEVYRSAPEQVRGADRHDMLWVIARRANTSTWETLLDLARHTSSNLDQLEIFGRLAIANDPALSQRAVDLADTGDVPATTRAEIILAAAEFHPVQTWDVVRRRWGTISAWLESNNSGRFFLRLLAQAQTRNVAEEFSAFAARAQTVGTERDLRKIRAGVMARQYVHDKLGKGISVWLDQRGR
jgi:aminopeptidase N